MRRGSGVRSVPLRFSDRLPSGTGPVLVSSGDYALEAQNAVPLEGLLETPDMFAFVELEAIAGSSGDGPVSQDLNGDGDSTDAVLVLRDRTTGLITPIGTASNTGRAATRIHQAPFSAPAVAAENDIAALLESEPLESFTDANGDGDVFDSILRVYRMSDCSGTPCAESLDTDDLAVDAEPIVEGQSLVVANGRVYFRASEAQNAIQTTIRVTGAPLESTTPKISGGGRHVTVMTRSDLIPEATGCAADTNGQTDIYALDRDPDGNGIFDEIPPSFVRMSAMSDGCQGDNLDPDVGFDKRSAGGFGTPDGRFVSVWSSADLDPTGQPDYYPGALQTVPGNEFIAAIDAYLHDRDTDEDGIFDEPGQVETRIVGLSSTGEEGNHVTAPASVSPEARWFVFSSRAKNLVPGEPDDIIEDVFIRDLLNGTTEVVSVHEDCVTRAQRPELRRH